LNGDQSGRSVETNQYAPFGDEFEKEFYSSLPDLQRFAEQQTEQEASLDGVSEE